MRSALSLLVASLLIVMGGATACIMEEKVVEIVVNGETTTDFQHGPSASESFTDDFSVSLAPVLDQALADAGFSRGDIKSAFLKGGAYGVTVFSHSHDWAVGGEVSVQRIDGTPGSPSAVLDYTVQSLEGALGKKTPVPLVAPGTEVIDQALTDYLAGGDPTLRFEVNNSDVEPPPTAADPIQFEWKIWVEVHVIVEEETEVPDPF